jgi:putative phosphoribosyl transferase
MHRTFADRVHAGRVLAGHLSGLGLVDPVVLALPRGGVCVAHPVAEVLDAPLDVLVARKLGAPSQPELAIGAIAEGGPRVLDREMGSALRVPADVLARIESAERDELARRVRRYRRGRPLPDLADRDVVLVDDGLATGMTAQAALMALRAQHPRSVVLAVPVGPPSTVRELGRIADDVVCLVQPEPFRSVGAWYDDFTQVGDREVGRLLDDRSDALAPSETRRRRRAARRHWVPARG